ncbi:MAG: bifunctional adenosylcobinamide kinase/adenosylcobinamide-phosphate guanylyltransferase [Nitrospiraceae bacterium]|nr:bifunctional adenosylcobinamide kinase/adenosylcobinamide-phosphate guanylyltransferase [Nitrospiraceae bacterium]
MADADRGETKGRIVFVTGGARSGKSSFALRQAEGMPGRKAFIATAEAVDDEMEDRIRRHREERSGEWKTFEEPRHIAAALRRAAESHDVIIIDCLTIWLSNMLCAGSDIGEKTADLTAALQEARHTASVFIVSNEVGMGIVPAHELARRFRDEAGRLNREIAEIADAVYLTVSGLPVKLKDGGVA